MRVTMLLLALVSAFAIAADNAVIAPRPATRYKPQATTLGTESITIPQMLSYQGKLTDTLGVPVGDTTYQVTFRLYTVATGGASFWNETQTVRTRGGLFSTLIGSVAPIESVPSSGSLYLGMAVAGGAELSPRLRLVGSAYSYLAGKSANSDLLQGKDTAALWNAKTIQGKDTTALDSRYVNEGQASSVTSNMIVDGTIAAVDLGQMGASSGQVMKWTGSAWAPRNDSVGGGGGGGTVTSVTQATGVLCTPNPITTTGTVGLDTTYSDGRYIKNQFASNQTASWRVTGQGRCSTSMAGAAAVHGINVSATGFGVRGDGTSFPGVYGTNTSNTYAAIEGRNNASSAGGFGVEGSGTATVGVFGQSNSNCGVSGASSTSMGVYGQSTSSFGVRGVSTNSFGVYGTGVSFSGVIGEDSSTTFGAVEGHNHAPSAGGYGVAGYGTAAIGVYGNSSGNCGVLGHSTSFPGVVGENTSTTYGAVVGTNSASSAGGFGVLGEGSAATGVYGHSNSNFGVQGVSNSSAGVVGWSTSGYGVTGASTSNSGVYGISTSGPGVIAEDSSMGFGAVEGHNYAPSAGGFGVAGFGNAAIGVYGKSTNGNGVVGYSDTTTTKGYGVFARARSHAVYGKSDYFKGVYGEAIDDDGVYGYAHGTTLYNYAGVEGQAGSDSTYGVKGSATVHSGVYGNNSSTRYAAVEGHNTTSSVGSAGVAGFGDTANTAAYGVYGLSHYIGVCGRSNYFQGVYGMASDDNGVMGYYNGTNSAYAGVWGTRGSYGYGVYYSGGLSGSGSKNCVMRTSRGPTALYCQESPENWFEDFGSGTLANGHAHVNLDALFLETVTVDQNHGIKVFLQQTSGDPVSLVVQKGTTGFDVNGPAGSSIGFDYRVVAKRKGFEDVRLDVVRAGYNDPVLYPNPNDPQIPTEIRAKRLEAARLAAMNNGAGPQPHPSNPTTTKKADPTGVKPQNGPSGR